MLCEVRSGSKGVWWNPIDCNFGAEKPLNISATFCASALEGWKAAKQVKFGTRIQSMIVWESLTSKDLRFWRRILDLRDVTKASVAEGPNRRCSKEWAACGRNPSKVSRLKGSTPMQSSTARFDGSGGNEGMLRNLHRRKSGAFGHNVNSDGCNCAGKQVISTSRRIGKSRDPITVSNASGTPSLPASKVILCQRSTQGMIKSSITCRALVSDCPGFENQVRNRGQVPERSR